MQAPKTVNVSTKAEVEAHVPMHAEYRSLCKYDVEGRAVSRQHEKGDQVDETLGVTASLDYCLWTPEECEEEMVAIWVGHDSETFVLWTMSVHAKGTQATMAWMQATMALISACHQSRKGRSRA